ncbi:MAG: DNA polymerase I [Ruminococcaceae bacterium]|nr:DNA polymerase I [Oscillospiraceae bacterium]
MAKEKFLIIDANSIINRAFYGIRLLTTKEGTYTNAVYGFLNIFYKFKEEIKPDYIAAAFDLKAPTFRHKMFDGYKATRHPMPEELVPQIPLLKEVLTALNIPVLEKEGYEADDIIGTISQKCTDAGIGCMILTGDKDDLQLATEDNKIYLVTTRMGNTDTEIFDAQRVFEKYGVTPKEFIDVKAIMGDTSDNIPGVRGIGEKGALSLISKFKSLDAIYENIESDDITKAMKTKLIESKETAFLSRTLATIDCYVPLDFDLEDGREKPGDYKALSDLYTRLEFKSFLKRLNEEAPQEEKPEPTCAQCEAVTLTDADSLKDFLQAETVYYQIDTKNNTVYAAKTADCAVCAPLSGAFLPVWKAFFENTEIKKVTHGAKEQFIYLGSLAINLQGNLFDTAIAAYLTDPGRRDYGLSELCFDLLGMSLGGDQTGEQLSFMDEPQDARSPLFDETAALISLHAYLLSRMTEEGSLNLFETVEMPLVEVLASMQDCGIMVDRERLLDFGTMLAGEITRLTDEIYHLAGEEFNINSPKQLGVILYDKLGLKSSKKTKTGYSTNAGTLEKLADSHPIIPKILEYRHLAKLNSTYVDGLKDVIDTKTGRIHSNFHQTVTVTGRISSSEPNLQNIPIRTELGREMRKMFVAAPGHVLLDADYSQIELRVLAHIAGDETMIEAFTSGQDIHASTASKIFGVAKEDVSIQMRTAAKAVNFGLIYGKGEFSLAQDLGISMREAKAHIEDYLGSFPKVRDYMKAVVEEAKKNGFCTTLMGRRRNLPELSSSNFQLRSFGERAALNTPIQGTAADIIKLAMVRVYNRLKEEKLAARLILQVHDELIVEAPLGEEEVAGNILREEMEQAFALSAPLVADMHSGQSWFDAK